MQPSVRFFLKRIVTYITRADKRVSIHIAQVPMRHAVLTRDVEAVETVKFLWKPKRFEGRSWKRKQTRKHLSFWEAGSMGIGSEEQEGHGAPSGFSYMVQI